MWHHPKYYEEMKRKRKELERQASSNKQKGESKDEHQASSDKRQAPEQEGHEDPWSLVHWEWIPKATSNKRQAPGIQIQEFWLFEACDIMSRVNMSQQASSVKQQAPGIRIQAASVKRQAVIKIFRCLWTLILWVQASGLRLPGPGYRNLHKVLEPWGRHQKLG